MTPSNPQNLNSEELSGGAKVVLDWVMTLPDSAKPFAHVTSAEERDLYARIESYALQSRRYELKRIPWKESKKYGINQPYLTKAYYVNRLYVELAPKGDNDVPLEVSLCDGCNCMTHTIEGICGKCHYEKEI